MYHQLVGYNNELTPYINHFFPFSYGRYVDMRMWVESDKKYGQRIGTRAWNAFANKLAAPKASPYHDLAFLFISEFSPMPTMQLINFQQLTDQQLVELVTHYVLDDFQRQQLFKYLNTLVQPVHLSAWAQAPRPLESIVNFDPNYVSSRRFDETKMPNPEAAPEKRGRGRPPKAKVAEESHVVQMQPMLPSMSTHIQNLIAADAETMSQLLTIKDDELAETAAPKMQQIIVQANYERDQHMEATLMRQDAIDRKPAGAEFIPKLAAHGLTPERWNEMNATARQQFIQLIQQGKDQRAALLKKVEQDITTQHHTFSHMFDNDDNGDDQ